MHFSLQASGAVASLPTVHPHTALRAHLAPISHRSRLRMAALRSSRLGKLGPQDWVHFASLSLLLHSRRVMATAMPSKRNPFV